MPLPHFLLLLVIVIGAAGVTIWLASSAGLPLAGMALLAVVAAGLVRLMARVE